MSFIGKIAQGVGNFTGSIMGGITGSSQQADAAMHAADTQSAAAQAGINEQRRQFDALQALLNPYVQAGTSALGAQQNLIGLGGASAQQSAIAQLQNSPEFQALSQQGQDAILQNASATGGLRGGNVQGALAQFQPAMLSQLINQQYQRLGGLTSIGQNAAAGTGNAGMQSANAIGNLLQQQGAAQAGGQLADGSRTRMAFNDMMKIGSMFMGGGNGGGF